MPRAIYSTVEQNKQSILFQATISPEIHCLHCCWSVGHPCSCLCVPLVSDIAKEATYVAIQENRIEFNYPSTTMTWGCNCQLIDDIHVIYFDRPHFDDIYVLEGCCCGYHKTVVLKQPVTTCSSGSGGCCGRIYLPCIEDADGFVNRLKDARKKRCVELHIDMER